MSRQQILCSFIPLKSRVSLSLENVCSRTARILTSPELCSNNYVESRDTNLDAFVKSAKTPSLLMGEGRGEGENTAISSSYIPLPFIPSHQGRGNSTFYETVNLCNARSLLRTKTGKAQDVATKNE